MCNVIDSSVVLKLWWGLDEHIIDPFILFNVSPLCLLTVQFKEGSVCYINNETYPYPAEVLGRSKTLCVSTQYVIYVRNSKIRINGLNIVGFTHDTDVSNSRFLGLDEDSFVILEDIRIPTDIDK